MVAPPVAQAGTVIYTVTGFVHHQQQNGSEHFVAYVHSHGKWLKCDDSRVTEVEAMEPLWPCVIFLERLRRRGQKQAEPRNEKLPEVLRKLPSLLQQVLDAESEVDARVDDASNVCQLLSFSLGPFGQRVRSARRRKAAVVSEQAKRRDGRKRAGRAQVRAGRADVRVGRAGRAQVQAGRADVRVGRARVQAGRADVRVGRARLQVQA
eukprot:s8318_g1.t1